MIKKKILHICLATNFFDNYSYQENVLPKLHKQMGFDVYVFSSLQNFGSNGRSIRETKPRTYINENNILVKRLKYAPFLLSDKLRIYTDFYTELQRLRPDILFIHNPQFIDIHKVLKYLKKRPEVKVYVDNHADHVNSAQNWFSKNLVHKFLWKACVKAIEPYTRKFYGVTPARVKFLEEMYDLNPKHISFLPMGSENEVKLRKILFYKRLIRRKHGLTKKDFIYISGGKFDNKKKIIELIRAFSSLPDARLKLLLFGSIADDIATVFWDEVHKDPRIIYLGWLTPDETYQYLYAAHVGVFPGTHSTLWEQTVGAGLPCIFKRWEGMTHLNVADNCLFMEETQELPTLLAYCAEPTRYERLRQNTITAAKSFFSYDNIARLSIQEV